MFFQFILLSLETRYLFLVKAKQQQKKEKHQFGKMLRRGANLN